MAKDTMCFKDYMVCKDDKKLSKTRKKINRKRKDGSSKNVYGWSGYGPPPGISGAPAGGGNGGEGAAAGGGGGMGESYQLAASDNTHDIKNVYDYGRRGMKFLDYLNDENEEEDFIDGDIDPEEPVGDDPDGESEEFDDDIYDLIKELESDGMEVEEIAKDTDLSVEEVEAYLAHYSETEDEYAELDFDKDNYGSEEDYPEDEESSLDHRDRFAHMTKEERDEEMEKFHARLRKERGGGFGDPRPRAEDEEEDEYNNILAAFDRNRGRGEEIDDFMGSCDDYDDNADRAKFEPRHVQNGDPADDLDMWSDEDEEATPVDDEDLDDAEYERQYDVERGEEDPEMGDPEMDDDPEYAEEIQVGDWTIRRIDDEDEDLGDEDYDYEGDIPSDEDFDDDPTDPDAEEERSDGFASYMADQDPDAYEEDAEEPSKKDQARALYRAMKSGEYSRKDIIGAFEKRLQLSPSSSTAYYERIAKEYGETEQQGEMDPMGQAAMGGMGQQGMQGMMDDPNQMGQEEPEYDDPKEWEDPHRQGVIRTVDKAHLVYKRQQDDGSFEELWLYKEGDKFQDEISIRHDIVAGTDIPVEKTQSPDGSQKAETWSVGDVQYMSITGLPN